MLHISIVSFNLNVKMGIGRIRKNEEYACTAWAGLEPGRMLQILVKPVENGVA